MTLALSKMLKKYQQEKLTQFALENEEKARCEVLFLGDSIMDLFKLEKYFKNTESLVNRGVSGVTSEFLLEHFSTLVGNYRPNKIFLLIGTNDLGQGDDSMTIYLRISDLCQKLLSLNPTMTLYLQSVYPTNQETRFQGTVGLRTNDRIEELNFFLPGIDGVIYLDIFSQLIDDDGQLRLDYTSDGLHLSATGYQVVADCLSPYL